jgi:hypothetical protein
MTIQITYVGLDVKLTIECDRPISEFHNTSYAAIALTDILHLLNKGKVGNAHPTK